MLYDLLAFNKSTPVCLVSDRLAIYYLNAVSKAYQNANLELKRKMQMVGKCFFVTDSKTVWPVISAVSAIGLCFLLHHLAKRWGEEQEEQQGQHQPGDERPGGSYAQQVPDSPSICWRGWSVG